MRGNVADVAQIVAFVVADAADGANELHDRQRPVELLVTLETRLNGLLRHLPLAVGDLRPALGLKEARRLSRCKGRSEDARNLCLLDAELAGNRRVIVEIDL